MPHLTAKRLILLGIAATLAGIGLGRFAYAALLPGLIDQGWLTESQAGFVGAANLLGYFLGALMASRAGVWLGTGRTLKISALVIALSFLASAWPAPVWWFSLWRLLAGIAGAGLMVLAPAAVMRLLPVARRQRAGALIFTGIGLGVLLSATLVPALMKQGLAWTWLALGLVSLPALWLVWLPLPQAETTTSSHPAGGPLSGPLLAVWTAYTLDAMGFVPHTVFWVDYLQRHLGQSSSQAGFYWGLLAAGAVCGPFAVAAVARRQGWQRTFFGALLVKGLAIVLPVFWVAPLSLAVSSFLVGALIPGMVASAAGRLAELVPQHGYASAWGRATALFALGQAVSAYTLAALYPQPGGATLIFWLGGAMLGLAALIQGLAGADRPGTDTRPH